MLIFDPVTGPRAEPPEQVLARVEKAFVDAFRQDGKPTLNTAPETPQGQLIASIAEMIIRQDNDLLYLCSMFNPLKAEGVWQDALGKINFLTRHPAINSKAKVKCVGRSGTFIPEGSLIRSSHDETEWRAVKSTNLTTDEFTLVEFECTRAGAIEAAPNTLNKIITTIAGWDSCTNEAAATVGQEPENQASFEARRYKSVAKNSRSFLDSVYSRIADLKGVLALCCRHNVSDNIMTMDGIPVLPHSVYICVLGGDDNQIAQALHETVGGGCDYTGNVEIDVVDAMDKRTKHPIKFNRPEDKATQVTIHLRKGKTTPPNADETIKDIVFNNFYGTSESQQYSIQPVERVIMGDTVYASRFIGPLYAAGFEQVISAQIAYKEDGGLADLIAVPINIAPSLSRDDITVEWAESAASLEDEPASIPELKE